MWFVDGKIEMSILFCQQNSAKATAHCSCLKCIHRRKPGPETLTFDVKKALFYHNSHQTTSLTIHFTVFIFFLDQKTGICNKMAQRGFEILAVLHSSSTEVFHLSNSVLS